MIEDEIIGRLEARNAELEQMVAVLMRHEARDDTIKVQRARIAELEAYVERIAKQKLTDEMGEHIKEIADYEGAYNYMVKDARDYLRAALEKKK